jgi:hypothetical protein
MRRWTYRILLAAVLLGATVWLYRVLFPGPEQVIRKQLLQVAKLVSFGPNEGPLAKLSNTQQLLGYFGPEVEINIDVPGRSLQTVTGSEQLRQAIMQSRSTLSSLSVEFLDISVVVEPNRTDATATLTVRAWISGDKDPLVEEMRFTFSKMEGDWLINKIETVKTLL